MLRGRCSCAISERPTPSLFASPSLTCILTPLFPIHPGNYPVTPLFPLLTQKQRGGGYPCSRFVLPSSALGVYPDPVRVSGACPACPELLGDPVGMVRRSCSAFSFSPLATRHSPPFSVIPGDSNRLENLAPNCKLSAVNCRLSPLTPIILAPLATAALRVVPAPIFTTTLSIHVGAPTISFLRAPVADIFRWPPGALNRLDAPSLFSLLANKSSYSRTYARLARKSNYSRTYAKQGGGVGCRNGNVPKICRRADIFILAGERRQTQEPV